MLLPRSLLDDDEDTVVAVGVSVMASLAGAGVGAEETIIVVMKVGMLETNCP